MKVTIDVVEALSGLLQRRSRQDDEHSGTLPHVLQPDLAAWGYQAPADAEPVADGFHYTSDTNDQWFTLEEITKILETDV